MKTTKTIITILFVLLAGFSYGQKNISTVEILTNPHCHSCKEKIETELVYTKGIKDAVLNMDTKILTVSFKKNKISKKEILSIIEKLGYKATLAGKDNGKGKGKGKGKKCKSKHCCN